MARIATYHIDHQITCWLREHHDVSEYLPNGGPYDLMVAAEHPPNKCCTPLLMCVTADNVATAAATSDEFVVLPATCEELLTRVQSLLRRYAERDRDAAEMERLRTTSERDPLTQMYNRRPLEELACRALAHASRSGEPLSLLILDVDNFKRINDNGGHQEGDVALKTLAEVCRQRLRRYDLTFRYGGDEFLILLPHTSQEEAVRVAKELCDLVRSATPITISVGTATYEAVAAGETAHWPRELHQLIADADEALLEAKRQGRDQVCCTNSIDKISEEA